MRITLNGKPAVVADQTKLSALLEGLKLTGRYAVEVNQQIVPRSGHATHEMCEGDRVEVVQAIGGG